MADMLAICLHLDGSDFDNGPLRVMPGTHRDGRLSATEIATFAKNDCVTCVVPEGGALLVCPLLLHASSACVVSEPRRVIHLEFATEELPHGLHWYDAIGRKSVR